MARKMGKRKRAASESSSGSEFKYEAGRGAGATDESDNDGGLSTTVSRRTRQARRFVSIPFLLLGPYSRAAGGMER
jgi:hypothetical protein